MKKKVNVLRQVMTKFMVFSHHVWAGVLRRIVWFKKIFMLLLIVNVVFLIMGPPVVGGLAQTTRTVIENTCPRILNIRWVTYINYYILILILVNIVVFFMWCHDRHATKRDEEYLRDVLRSDNERLPAVDIDELIRRVTGLKTPNQDPTAYSETSAIILGSIDPITTFLDGDIRDGSILMVDAPWGAGKTTAVLIAINLRQKEQNIVRRYIYESSFKYTGSTGDFGCDLVSSLCDTLSEFGLDVRSSFIGVIQNIDFSVSKLLPSLLKSTYHKSDGYLTTELVNKINSSYHRHLKMGSNPLEVVVVLDDMDRLQGEDIIKALSILSIIRRLVFVKIIVPVDLRSIVRQLKEQCKITNPDKFVRKYLSGQKSVKLKSDEEIVEQIALRKIKSLQDNPPADGTEFCAAWAAIIIRLVSDKLHADLRDVQGLKLQWLGRFKSENLTVPSISKIPCQELLQESSDRVDHIVDGTYTSYGRKYKWPDSMKTDIRNFEDIILKPQKRDGTPVLQDFTEDEYNELVGSWIFGFAQQYWAQIDATLRDVLDLISAGGFSNLSLNHANQFKQVLSALFPESRETIGESNNK